MSVAQPPESPRHGPPSPPAPPVSPRGMLPALVLPLTALALQWALWDYIRPYAWFLFYPAVFLASWTGGMAGGIAATLLSAVLVLFFFVSPSLSFIVDDSTSLLTMGMFLAMGMLFSLGHQRLRDAAHRAAGDLERQRAALAEADATSARLRKANAELVARCERAHELDALKTRFFANISHELRTPLTLLLGPLERLLAETPEDDERRRALGTMLRNARLLHLHVDDMLDLSRVDAGAMQPRHAEADLSALTRATCASFDTLAAQRGMRYGVQAPLRLAAQVDTDMDEYIEKPVDAQALRRLLARLVGAPGVPVEKVGPA